jgi:Protein of unknown function (DUF3168)
MSVETGLFELVTSNAGIKAAVGLDASGTTARAFWGLAPQNTPMPLLIFSRVSTVDTYTMAGATGLRNSIFQISSYSPVYYQSRQIASLVRQALENFKGVLPDAEATKVQGVLTTRDFDLKYEEGGKSFTFAAVLQFRVFYIANR